MTDVTTNADDLFDRFARERDAVPDISQLVARELDRRAATAAESQRAAELERLRGGPCSGCGTVLSVVWQDHAGENGTAAIRSELIAYWRSCEGQPVCFECDQLRGQTYTLADLKASVVYELMPASEAKFWLHPALAQRLRDVPVLWCEQPSRPVREAPGSVAERFSFVDMSTVLTALAPPRPHLHSGPACPSCGQVDAWTTGPADEVRITDATGKIIDAFQKESTWCTSCTSVPSPSRPAPMSTSKDPGWLGGSLGSLDPLHSNAKAS